MKKRVLHILNTSSYSGAENVAISIINNMSKDIECAYASYDGSIKELLEKDKILFFPLKSMSISEVRRIVKLFNPDIIHAHDYTASIISAISGVRVSIISHLHNNSPWIKKYHPFSFLFLFSIFRYKRILSVSNSIIDEYVFGGLIKGKSIVISNPINLSSIIEKAADQKSRKTNYDIIFLGRLATAKNPLRFIELINQVTVVLPDIRVVMAGDGHLREDCEKRINDLNLQNNIHLLGFSKNPYELIASSKILCMTSNWEGFGLVAIEALALGVPVVATPVGGLPDILDNECGLLTNENSEYIKEIIKLLNDKQYLNEKSLKAKEKARMLDNINSYFNKLSEIYREMV